ncbi:MAG: PorT family protein [Bacteroidaceae bacterium]|nr:PorT family protein [Bacteroidaceae bacterium]
MKKILSTLMVAVALLFVAAPAQAQFSWGIKGGVNLSKVDFSDAPANLKADNFTGFFVGPMAEFTLPIVGLGIDGSLLYSQTGISFTGDDEETGDKIDETLKSHSIEIPINLKYSIGLGKLASVYAAAGPQFAFALSQDEWKNYLSKPFKKSQLSLNLGVGVKLINHLQAGVTYNIPLGDTADFEDIKDGDAGDMMNAGWSAITAKNKTWKIHVAYIF